MGVQYSDINPLLKVIVEAGKHKWYRFDEQKGFTGTAREKQVFNKENGDAGRKHIMTCI